MKQPKTSPIAHIAKACSCLLILAMSLSAHAQTCNDNIKATTPDSRFQIISGGSEVKDKVTGLIWQRCSLGQTWDGNTCTGTAKGYTWHNALKEVKKLGNGYRLPNIKELSSIVELKCHSPAINTNIFPNILNGYWSSSPDADGYNYAWGVYFDNGDDDYNNKAYSNYVRAVR